MTDTIWPRPLTPRWVRMHYRRTRLQLRWIGRNINRRITAQGHGSPSTRPTPPATINTTRRSIPPVSDNR